MFFCSALRLDGWFQSVEMMFDLGTTMIQAIVERKWLLRTGVTWRH